MTIPATATARPPFRRRRLLAAFAIAFLTVESAGISLSLFILLAQDVRNLAPAALTPDVFATMTAIGLFGAVITSIPALAFCAIMTALFFRFRWTRRLGLALGFSVLLCLAAFGLGWAFIVERDNVIRGMMGGGKAPWFLAASVIAAVAGTWVLHRYFKIVERNER